MKMGRGEYPLEKRREKAIFYQKLWAVSGMKTGRCDTMDKKVTVCQNFNKISLSTIKNTLNKKSEKLNFHTE